MKFKALLTVLLFLICTIMIQAEDKSTGKVKYGVKFPPKKNKNYTKAAGRVYDLDRILIDSFEVEILELQIKGNTNEKGYYILIAYQEVEYTIKASKDGYCDYKIICSLKLHTTSIINFYLPLLREEFKSIDFIEYCNSSNEKFRYFNIEPEPLPLTGNLKFEFIDKETLNNIGGVKYIINMDLKTGVVALNNWKKILNIPLGNYRFKIICDEYKDLILDNIEVKEGITLTIKVKLSKKDIIEN